MGFDQGPKWHDQCSFSLSLHSYDCCLIINTSLRQALPHNPQIAVIHTRDYMSSPLYLLRNRNLAQTWVSESSIIDPISLKYLVCPLWLEDWDLLISRVNVEPSCITIHGGFFFFHPNSTAGRFKFLIGRWKWGVCGKKAKNKWPPSQNSLTIQAPLKSISFMMLHIFQLDAALSRTWMMLS